MEAACRGWEGDLADARGERRPASVASVSSSALSVSPRRGGGHSLGTMVSPGWFRGRRKHSDVRNVGNGSGRKQPKVLEKWD